MAHGLNTILKRGGSEGSGNKTGIGSRRIFAPAFKLQVLDSYRNDADCKGNQRATARKYGIHRRQIQKWLQVENNLRNSVVKSAELALSDRQRDDSTRGAETDAATVPDKRVPDIPDTISHSPPLYPPQDFTDCFPIDLSLKPRRMTPSPTLSPTHTPILRTATFPIPCCPFPTHPTPPHSHPEIWDLSTKRPLEETINPRPVKLFKPYLDNVIEEVIPSPPPKIITNLDSNYNIPHHPNNNYGEYQVEYAYDYYYPAYSVAKQRQSYSLDFKLSAIECYYSDEICRGNQRAVASKFKIHRRQVQKWLKQEDELKQRAQPLNIVR